MGAEVFRANVPLQGVVLAEALVARGVFAAAEALLAGVDVLVAAQTGCRQERLAAAIVGTGVCSLLGVGALDMLAEVLLLTVVLVAARVCALEGAVVGVGAQVGGQAGGTVEGLVAVGIGAGDCLEV